MEEKNIIAIEIGSSKIKGALGSYSPSGGLTVKAVEEEPLLDWVRYGAVSNVEETSRIVSHIIRKIENRTDNDKVAQVYVALGGRSCSSRRNDVEQNLPEEVEITDEILHQLHTDAARVSLPDRDLLAVVTREYLVDNKHVEKPKGTVGRNVRYSANLITCRIPSKRNIDIIFKDKLHMDIAGYQVRQLAIGDIVLSSQERRLGCMLVDFGAETTTVSIYRGGYLQYMATLPLGSRNITRDLTALHFLEEKAEEIKRREGNASGNVTNMQPLNGIDITAINNYVSNRAGEIIANIRKQIEYAGYRPSDLSAGIIIVGRGANLNGFNDRLAQATSMKIRAGVISSPRIRIADSRISASDAVDIISVMYRAAVCDAKECLKHEEVIELADDTDETVLTTGTGTVEIPLDGPEPDKKERKKGKKSNPFIKLRDTLAGFLDDSNEDMDEDDKVSLDDDPDE